MFGRLMPREGRFFDLFNAHAEQIVLGSKALAALLAEPGNPAGLEAVDAAEKAADQHTHDTVALLHTTFITPLDRDEIHRLITAMDDVLDLMQDVAECIGLYDVRRVPDAARELAEVSVTCCERVREAVALLNNMGNGTVIMQLCREISRIESDADRVMRAAMSHLFRDEPDVRELIKLKAIYEMLETITDRCDDVANIIEGIVLENS